MSDAPTPLLTARDLRRDFAMGEETVHAVRGVSIDFDAGAYVAASAALAAETAPSA